jgi:plastocyanin
VSREKVPSGIGGAASIILASGLLFSPARAQTACITPNCGQGTIPAACLNRATPSTATVLMTSTLVFNPASPKIEPGDCVQWRSSAFVHSSSADPCPDDVLTSCASASPPSCLWDSGNVSSSGTPPAVVCYYDPATYPPTTADGFYCRLHDNPAHTGTMHGTLQVTTPIQLTVDKNVGAGSVVLTWSGGGVAGDVTYKVVRSNAGDPTFPAPSITTFNPDGGTAGIQFTDAAELAGTATRYYLIRNRQINE